MKLYLPQDVVVVGNFWLCWFFWLISSHNAQHGTDTVIISYFMAFVRTVDLAPAM